MKKTIFLLAMAAMLIAGTDKATAQNDNERENRRAEAQTRQTERIIKDLKLTDEQKAKFEPIYQNYLQEMATAQVRRNNENDEQNADAKDLTEAQATARLQALFDRQADQIRQSQLRLDIEKKYCAELSAILTPQQLLRVFQVRQNRNRGGQPGGRGSRGGFGGGPRGGFGGQGGFGGPDGGF